MIVTLDWIEKHYTKFNNLYWDGTLPGIKFSINRSKRTWGYAQYRFDYSNDTIIPESITMSNYYDSPEYVKCQVLLHEMIHIADYFWHPEHFIFNGHRVSGRSYDAHGSWFLAEAKRISQESGLTITNKITMDEFRSSKISDRTKKCLNNRRSTALICAAIRTDNVWYFKTDIYKVEQIRHTINNYFGASNVKIKFYTFDNDSLAERRSVSTKLRGWNISRSEFVNTLQNYKATEVRF